MDGRAEEVAIAVASAARRDLGYASDAIARALRQRRDLSSRERRDVADRVYGLLRMHRRVDAICGWLLRPRGRTPEDLPPAELDRLRYLVYRVDAEGASAQA